MAERVKFFKNGHRSINIRPDLFEAIANEAEDRDLLPAQVLQEIVKKHYGIGKLVDSDGK